MASTLELVASSLLLLPWSCWWTEVSEGPAWSLNPLQEEERGVSSFAPCGCNPEPPRTSASRRESFEAKKAQGQLKDRLGQDPQKNLKLRGCVSAHLNPIPFSTPWPCVVLPKSSYQRLMLWSAPCGRNLGLPAK